MKEYIERGELLKELERFPHLGTAGSIVRGMKKADVAPVVRCKDCQWWEARSFGSLVGRCNNPLNGLVSEYLDDEDFCSYGERKDN